jgi:hypothetical protein
MGFPPSERPVAQDRGNELGDWFLETSSVLAAAVRTLSSGSAQSPRQDSNTPVRPVKV